MESQPYCINHFLIDLFTVLKRISALISNQFNLKVLLIFKTFKVKNYFLFKSRTPKALLSNVIYKFTGSCDTNMTCIDMSSRHLITKVRERLNFKVFKRVP